MTPLVWISFLSLWLGLGLWLAAYLKFVRKLPHHNQLRALPCLPGLLLAVLGVILGLFAIHWLLGAAAICLVAYTFYAILFGRWSQ